MAASASRCVVIVRRAGKSPPGGARRARSAPREQRSEQQHRSAQPADQRGIGLVAVTRGQRTRSVVSRCPRPRRQGRPAARAITSTSRMRGTLVSTHSSVVSRQAASSGSAAFLLPSTVDPARQPAAALNRALTYVRFLCTRGARAGSPAPMSSIPGRRSLRAASTPKRVARRRALQRSMSARMSPAVAPPSLTMKLPCVGRHAARRPRARPSAPRDRRARQPTTECRRARDRVDGSGFWKMQPALGDVQRLRALAERQRLAGDGAERGRIARRDPKDPPTADLAASDAAGCDRSRTPSSAAGTSARAVRAVDDRDPRRPARRSGGRRSARCRRPRRQRFPACRPTPRGRRSHG